MKTLIPIICFALVACSKEETGSTGCGGCGDAHEARDAKHGGLLIEFGNHDGLLEVVVDHATGAVTLYVYDHEMADMSLDKAPVLIFASDDTPHQVTGEGEGGLWTFTHDGLQGEPEGARFRITAGGKTFNADWAHQH